MSVSIRMLRAEEWPLWRDLRLQALADSPDAFGPTLEEEANQPHEWWSEIVETTASHPRGGLWVADTSEDLVGMLFGRLSRDFDLLEVGAMWVAPRFRRLGVGTELLAAVFEWARNEGAGLADLWVTESNSAGESFYRQAGFRPTSDTKPLRKESHLTVRKFVADL